MPPRRRASPPPPPRTTHHAPWLYRSLLRFGKEAPTEDVLEARQGESGSVARLDERGLRVVEGGLGHEQVEDRRGTAGVPALLHPEVLARHGQPLRGQLRAGARGHIAIVRGRHIVLHGSVHVLPDRPRHVVVQDRKSTRLNSSHSQISYAVFCLKKKKNNA